jgi:hypothetical protein
MNTPSTSMPRIFTTRDIITPGTTRTDILQNAGLDWITRISPAYADASMSTDGVKPVKVPDWYTAKSTRRSTTTNSSTSCTR